MKVLTEILQFVPIITLASNFIVKGNVDLSQAGVLFAISGAMAVAVTVWLAVIRETLNPILLGSNIWLVSGAVAFGIPVAPLATLLSNTNAVLLFATVLLVGIVQTLAKTKSGFIGMSDGSPQTIRKLSFILLGVAAVALVWTIIFKDNIRIGGGLPFIVLNVTRRILTRRGQQP